MKLPSVSVIIPTLNESINIGGLLKEVRRNNGCDVKDIIVADSGSSDNTVTIARKLGAKVVRAGRGPAAARNAGAKKAKGDFILFLDADQMIDNNFIGKSLREIVSRKLDIAGYYSKPDCNDILDKAFWFFCNNVLFRPLQYFYPAGSTGSGLWVRRTIHDRIQGFDEEIGVTHDHDYVRRSSRYGRYRMLNSIKSTFNMRRFHKEGRVRVYGKYSLLVMLHVLKIKSTPVEYEFGKH